MLDHFLPSYPLAVRRMSCALLTGLFAATLCTSAHADSALFTRLKTELPSLCEKAKTRLSLATTSAERDYAQTYLKLQCECLPAEFERRVAVTPALREMTLPNEVEKLLVEVAATCAASKLRAAIDEICPTAARADVSIFNPERHCVCMKNKLAAVPDVDLATFAAKAIRMLRDTLRRLRPGKLRPPR